LLLRVLATRADRLCTFPAPGHNTVEQGRSSSAARRLGTASKPRCRMIGAGPCHMAARLGAQNAKTILGVAVGDALDEAGEHFLGSMAPPCSELSRPKPCG